MRSLLLSALGGLLLLPTAAAAQTRGGPPTGGPEGQDDDGDGIIILDSPFEALELECIEERNGESCYAAGQKWFVGEGLERPNVTQAVNLWQAGCTFGHARSCLGAAILFKEGKAGVFILAEDGQVSIDLGSAERYFRLACDFGILEACGLDGELLMAPQKTLPAGATWHDLEEDMFSGRQSFEVGCPALSEEAPVWAKRDARSCARLAQIWEQGFGVRRLRSLATEYWDLACAAEGNDGEGGSCDEAKRIRALTDGPVEEEEPRKSIQPHRPRPKVDRFRNADIGIVGTTSEDHYRRFELEGGVGARVRYPTPNLGSALATFKMRAGIAIWFNVIGIGLDTAFSTDKFAAVQYRLITRFQHSLILKTAFPLRVKIPWGAVMRLGLGGGLTFGSVKFHPAPYVVTFGSREYIQIEIGSGQTSGARQWGALRLEQQQSWYKGGGLIPEHSTSFVLIAGFTFAGKGPDWTPRVHLE
jgi:hypothetical protein